MSRLCERPGCGEPASVSYGFDPRRQLAWLATLEPLAGGAPGGVLCQRHADAMVMPRGWWLDDRRRPVPQLFVPPPPSDPTPTGGVARPSRRRRTGTAPPQLLDIDGPPAGAPAPEPRPAETADPPADSSGASAWSPVNLPRGDLDGLLDVRSPLLARAFGRVSPEAPVRREH
jgi:hypothetical protein